ncbi:MFS transporter [Alphaproteobacteria bacterium KMM 3653]|uniref:MFS transporter n=1 Tax=Harenicola maris TaxID=2841044 RepID=A0AAP2G6Z8_9RHOB|nr:MFS transporter [Harenicola maris]
MNVEQPLLGRRGTLLLLVALGTFPPLSIHLYLPALPQMAETFATTPPVVNLTLGAHMVAFAIAMLFWGPLSERTGRKPILLTALALYITASLLCALSQTIEALIAFRILQGFAGGGVTVIGTTIVKDIFDGPARERALALVMSMVIIAPMTAPVLGAFLLSVASWQALFLLLALFGCAASLLVVLFRETLPEKSTGPLLRAWGRLGVVLANPRFTYLLLTFSLSPMCLMAFVGTAVYIYIDGFGLSEQAFSLIFGANALFAIIGPSLYLRLRRVLAGPTIILGAFTGMTLAGVAMLLFGHVSPFVFAAIAATCTTCVIVVRVPGTNLLLDQQSRDIGSAAGLIQFGATIMGASAVQIVPALSPDLITNYACLLIAVGATCSLLWLCVRRRPFVTGKGP